MQASNINHSELGKHALMVIGMHRSGTSATTGALQCLGVQLGRKLYAGHSSINPKGYFEHNDITDLDDEALLRIGSCWDDVLLKEEGWHTREELRPFAASIIHCIRRDFAEAPLWALKDPRVCRMLPWWLNILSAARVEPHFLFVIRSPGEVCYSLKWRDGFSEEKAFLLWILHYLEAERATRGHARAFMVFDRLLDDPVREFLRVEQQLGLRFPVSVESVGPALKQFLSKDLKHHTLDSWSTPSPVIDLAYELAASLLLSTLHPGSAPDPGTMDRLWQRLGDIESGFSPILVEQLRAVNRDRGQTQLTLNRVMRSWSHYAGKPIRFVERLLGRNV